MTVTPFDESGSLMTDAFEEILRWHLSHGAEGLCVAGGNGECWALSTDELREVTKIAVRVAAGRVPVIAGAMGPTTITVECTVERVRAVAESGATAALMGPQPFLGAATRDEVVRRFAEIYQLTRFPIVIYNIPRQNGIVIDAELLEAIAGEVDLVGLKDASRDFHAITEMIAAFSDRFCVFIGPGWFIVPGTSIGADGFLSTGPELLGKDAARLIQVARDGTLKERKTLHVRTARIYYTLIGMGLGTSPAPLKAALNLMGLPAGVPRAPIQALRQEARDQLARHLDELGISRK